jgi:hypothetical protein
MFGYEHVYEHEHVHVLKIEKQPKIHFRSKERARLVSLGHPACSGAHARPDPLF